MNKDILFIDFETQSACDLKKCGSDVYSKHWSTKVICVAYAFNDEPVQLLTLETAFPHRIRTHIAECGKVVAHNATFEFQIWNNTLSNRNDIYPLRIEQIVDTMALSHAMGLPGSLDRAALAAGIEHKKDAKGHRIMLQLSQPRTKSPLTWWDKEEFKDKYEQLYSYCKQDVEVERALYKRLAPLLPKERKMWELDFKINERGLGIDVESAKLAMELVETEQERLNAKIVDLTDGYVGGYNASVQFVKWLNKLGVETDSIAKANLDELLNGELPPVAREALLVRKEAAKSSTAKLSAMIDGSSEGRARNLFCYHGATTGRWSGRKIQVQNLPRGNLSESEIGSVFRMINASDEPIDMITTVHGSLMDSVASCLRGFIVPAEGKEFICADFSAIEARVLAWLAGQESVLKIFRGDGKIYEHTASGIYRVSVERVTKDQRQIGKVANLALGYGGGVGAFQSMARAYGVKVSDEESESIKKAWREANSDIVSYWYDLENAAMSALKYKGQAFKAGAKGREVYFKTSGSFLCCKLPSGRIMYYPYPKMQKVETPWGEMKNAIVYKSVNALTKQWEDTKTYGGSLAENVTQAVARDFLAEAIMRVEENKYPVVLHCHDEILCEVPFDFGSVKELENLMCVLPEWGAGCPIEASGWESYRYKK